MMDMEHYMILDAAKMSGYIYQAQGFEVNYKCLYEGDSEKFLGSVAPWLFELNDAPADFIDWICKLAPGNSWGVILRSDADSEVVYKHLRKFLIVHTEEGKELYFRYYDPRVLRVFLPTCETEQLLEFFGPLNSILMEDEEGIMIEFKLNETKLECSSLQCDLKEFLAGTSEEEPKPMESSELLNPDSDSSKGLEEKKDKWDFGF
jgi:hypothetical protein